MTDGCPDLVVDNSVTYDSDGDRIVDNLDSCPNSTRDLQWFPRY